MPGRFEYVMARSRISRSRRAGLLFPVGQVHRYLRKSYTSDRVGKLAPIYLTSVLEYTMSEILETAGHLAKLLRDDRRGTDLKITPRHIRLAIVNDDELKKVFRGAIIPSSGADHLSRKTIRQMKSPTYEVGDSSDEEEVREHRGRKGGVKQTSRASSHQRRGQEQAERKSKKKKVYQDSAMKSK